MNTAPVVTNLQQNYTMNDGETLSIEASTLATDPDGDVLKLKTTEWSPAIKSD